MSYWVCLQITSGFIKSNQVAGMRGPSNKKSSAARDPVRNSYIKTEETKRLRGKKEYGRLNLNYNVVSNRKIFKLIESGVVAGWDDPRLFNLTALRRRGFPPEAINSFCERIGLTMSQTVLDPSSLEACVHVNIANWNELYPNEPSVELDITDFPSNPGSKTHKAVLISDVYIDSTDFQEIPDKGYQRLTPSQSVWSVSRGSRSGNA
ncbi:Glutamine--tRNA ligase [Fasciola hepatica]|uniref:Glutamine--tRNA ligase n=1 Tax=Fasciola hepatica TaxID=6192 RepID=A0A4E0R151_FASHE|nr:Glutamine--tRNA ligase [Fasciola hepatica]